MAQTQPKMSFVMPAYKSADTIGRAIESLLDQDYKNYEIIVCLDGDDSDIHHALDKYKSKIWKIHSIEHSGACAARNAGAKSASGDYISFFSSDFVAQPGMLRRWIEVFQENPDADFIYGGYLFWDSPGAALYSEPFNPYTLTCYNYIDGGFPVKRRVWEENPWDENFKSLNDWEWILRIALNGNKGVFIPDFSYAARTPQPGGLSEDSNRNWLARRKQIMDKHGIPEREICFCSMNYQEEAKKLAQHMGQDYLPMPSFKPHKYKLIYQIGFSIQHTNECSRMFLNAPNTRKVVHWMPMDVRMLKQLSMQTIELLAAAFQEAKIQSLACTNEDVTLLAKCGFKVRLSYYFAYSTTSVNGDFKVWLPNGMDDLKQGIPDIPLTDNRNESSVDVLINPPWGEVAESLLAGKTVLSNFQYPDVMLLQPKATYPELREEIVNTLRRLPGRNRPTADIRKLCSEKAFRKELQRLCK